MGLPVAGTCRRCTLGPPDSETTLRQRSRISSFVSGELGRDMIKVNEALQGSSPAELRPRNKRQTQRTTEDEDVEPSEWFS